MCKTIIIYIGVICLLTSDHSKYIIVALSQWNINEESLFNPNLKLYTSMHHYIKRTAKITAKLQTLKDPELLTNGMI